MKKISKLTVLLLALVMVLSLCACGGNDAGKDLVGTWAIDYDLANVMASELGSDYADFKAPLELTLLFDFNDDGTYKMYVEEGSFTANFSTWMDAFIDYSIEMMYDMYEGMSGLSREEVDAVMIEEYGVSVEDDVRQSLADLDMNALVSEMIKETETTGTYETKGNKLFLAEGSDKIDSNSYDIFTVDGNKLTLELADGVDRSEAEILPGLSYPLVFMKR